MFFFFCFLKILLSFAFSIILGLQEPDHKLFSLHPTINNDLLCQLKLGTINPQKDIKSFTKDSVEFLDGTVIPVDVVVFATGYDMGFPMLQDVISFPCFEMNENNLFFYLGINQI